MTTLKEWCQEKLLSLEYEVSEDLIKYLISMENSDEIEAYLSQMLDVSDSAHYDFINEFISRWKSESSDNLVRYKKPEIIPEQFKKSKVSKKKGKDFGLETMQIKESKQSEISPKKELKTSSAKKKPKFLSIYSPETKDVITLPGRYPCICQGSKHKLINNCLRCGRIVCEQEGSGPCLTCKNLVCSKEEQDIITKGTKQSEKLYIQLMGKGNEIGNIQLSPKFQDKTGLEKAVEHKNKLLEYDRTVEKRTQVIDDESDYYSLDSNTWLSPAERKELKKKEEEIFEKKHRSRKEMKITFDFAGRKLYESEDSNLNTELKTSKLSKETNIQETIYANPTISIIPKYESNEDDLSPRRETVLWDENLWLRKMRIQDTELQKMSDEGLCLSVQQPWASFLISGIKQHEGRTWYTPHRGRLWIHAGGKIPTQQEISQLENSTRIIKQVNYIKFPEQYPTGVLLGCVDVIDCLPQEEYQLQYPNGESGSPYVLICENPQELKIKFPMKGKLKIFKLDKKIHQAARKTTQKIEEIR